jgi:hypothetical protein
MKALKLTLALLLAAFCTTAIMPGQTAAPASTTSASTSASCTATSFDPVYWAHQPPQVAALAKMPVDYSNPVSGGRTSTAIALATAGFTIDGEIDVWGFDPCWVMLEHSEQGYTWYPSLLQPPILVAPNLTFNGQSYNPNAPPAGSIKVSLSLSDYPPFAPAPPATATVATPASCVGFALGAGYYAAPYYATVQACQLANGAIYTADPRGYFTFHLTATPFGSSVAFTINPAQ